MSGIHFNSVSSDATFPFTNVFLVVMIARSAFNPARIASAARKLSTPSLASISGRATETASSRREARRHISLVYPASFAAAYRDFPLMRSCLYSTNFGEMGMSCILS